MGGGHANVAAMSAFVGKNEKHMLTLRISGFDPFQGAKF